MIHSCAGGILKDNNFYDFAKVVILSNNQISWYISDILGIKENDIVIVPFGGSYEEAKVIRIDKNVSQQVAPFPIKRMKKILKKVEK